jgi:hypothetical protein
MSSRKRQNLTNDNHRNNGILNCGLRTRRCSVPARKYLDTSHNNAELHTINEVSE